MKDSGDLAMFRRSIEDGEDGGNSRCNNILMMIMLLLLDDDHRGGDSSIARMVLHNYYSHQ